MHIGVSCLCTPEGTLSQLFCDMPDRQFVHNLLFPTARNTAVGGIAKNSHQAFPKIVSTAFHFPWQGSLQVVTNCGMHWASLSVSGKTWTLGLEPSGKSAEQKYIPVGSLTQFTGQLVRKNKSLEDGSAGIPCKLH